VGWITLLAFTAPDAEGRERVRQRAGHERYVEVLVQRGGSSEPPLRYQAPARPDLAIDLGSEPLEQAAARVVALLEGRGFIR
jgi:adenylylsulfate kinase-like enzyme